MYVVKTVWSNRPSYLLEEGNEERNVKVLRAHYNQLRGWRELPKHIMEHSIRKLLREEKEKESEETEVINWGDHQPVLVECKRRSKRRRRKSKGMFTMLSGESTHDGSFDFEGSDKSESVRSENTLAVLFGGGVNEGVIDCEGSEWDVEGVNLESIHKECGRGYARSGWTGKNTEP